MGVSQFIISLAASFVVTVGVVTLAVTVGVVIVDSSSLSLC